MRNLADFTFKHLGWIQENKEFITKINVFTKPITQFGRHYLRFHIDCEYSEQMDYKKVWEFNERLSIYSQQHYSFYQGKQYDNYRPKEEKKIWEIDLEIERNLYEYFVGIITHFFDMWKLKYKISEFEDFKSERDRKKEENRVNSEIFKCSSCGLNTDPDLNHAINMSRLKLDEELDIK